MSGLLPDFGGLTVAVLGDFVADEYVFGRTERISREAPVPIVEFERSELRLGAAGNVANNLASLGVRVRAIGALGTDAAGKAIQQACRAAKIDTSHLSSNPEIRTAMKMRVLAGALHTTRQQLLRLDRGERLGPIHSKRVAAELRQAIRNADALVISDYGLGNAGPEIGPLCAKIARTMPVFVDSRFNLLAYKGVTLAKPNASELRAIVGDGDLDRAAARFREKQRLDSLLVTRGRDGLSLFAKDRRPFHLAAFGPSEAVDVTGAGDTVLAAFAAVFARTHDGALATEVANVAGGIVVQKPGTAVVTRQEIEQGLEGR